MERPAPVSQRDGTIIGKACAKVSFRFSSPCAYNPCHFGRLSAQPERSRRAYAAPSDALKVNVIVKTSKSQ